MSYIEKNKKSLLFLCFVLILYLLIFLINNELFFKSLSFSIKLFSQIIPILFIVFILIFITNTYDFKITKTKEFIGSIFFGIISSGPIYAWYPFLKQMREKGVSLGAIASFLYARSIKIPFLPFLIYFFGLKYTFIFISILLLFSILEYFLFNFLEPYLI